jgi:cytoskeletal protein CcmA (bactofilin family)
MADCTIGTGIVVNGRITGDEPVSIEGRVEGTIVLSNHVSVETSGTVVADVEADSITIQGSLNGNVVARDAITLVSGCAVTGNLRAPRIIIEEGARFKGNIEMDVDIPKN